MSVTFIGGALPPILHKVEVPFIGKKDCESWFDDGDRHQDIESVFICAGYKNGGRDACQVRIVINFNLKFLTCFVVCGRVILVVQSYRKWMDAGPWLASLAGALGVPSLTYQELVH
jgi:Trypsin